MGITGLVKLVVVPVLLAALLFQAARRVDRFGVMRAVWTHHPGGSCREVVGNFRGAEDLQALSDGHVIAASGLDTYSHKFPQLYKGPKLLLIKGHEVVAEFQYENFDAEKQKQFKPHGLFVKELDRHNALVFVVNHPPGGDTVDMFTWDRTRGGTTLKHYNSVSAAQLGVNGNINDVLIISETSFYVTNYKFKNYFIGRIFHALGVPACKMLYWDGSQASVVSSGHIEPNGVNMSPDGSRVYLTDPMDNKFFEFSRDAATGQLTRVATLALPTGPDNIEVVDENTVLLGCHPKLHQLFEHLVDPENVHSPSQVLQLKRKDPSSPWEASELFADDGRAISGSSVGVLVSGKHGHKHTLYIGSVVDKVLMCDVDTL